jgi:hypothetical protein
MISLVLSFPLHQPHHFSGKDITFAKKLQRIESTRSPTGTINNNNKKKKKHLSIHTKLGAASAENDGDDDDKHTTATTIRLGGTDDGYDGLGDYDPSENLPKTQREVPNVGDPQLRVKEKDWSVTDILKELAAIQQKGPQKYCILGTRHCSYLHQQIIELLCVATVFHTVMFSFIPFCSDFDTMFLSCAHLFGLLFSLFVVAFFVPKKSNSVATTFLPSTCSRTSSAYALVLSGNHVYTSGAPGTNGKKCIPSHEGPDSDPVDFHAPS